MDRLRFEILRTTKNKLIQNIESEKFHKKRDMHAIRHFASQAVDLELQLTREYLQENDSKNALVNVVSAVSIIRDMFPKHDQLLFDETIARIFGSITSRPDEEEIEWLGSNYGIELSIRRSDAISASHPGECEAEVLDLLNEPYIMRQLLKINPESLRKELNEYGTWEEAELANHWDNLLRIVWLAAGDIAEQKYEQHDATA